VTCMSGFWRRHSFLGFGADVFTRRPCLGSAQCIGEAVLCNRNMTRLNCAYNPFGDMGCQHIANALQDNKVSRSVQGPQASALRMLPQY
jgi:hypothetical protein